jgi:hypothetical protein
MQWKCSETKYYQEYQMVLWGGETNASIKDLLPNEQGKITKKIYFCFMMLAFLIWKNLMNLEMETFLNISKLWI